MPTDDTDKPIDRSKLTEEQRAYMEKVDELGHKFVDFMRLGAEYEALLHFVIASVSGSRLIDRAASWLLVGVGATVALMVSALEQIVGQVGTTGYKTLLFILLLAAICGLAQKLAALSVQVTIEIAKEMLDKGVEIGKKFLDQKEQIAGDMDIKTSSKLPDLRFSLVGDKYKKLLPKIWPPWLKRLILGDTESDVHYMEFYRKILRTYTIQRVFFGLEYLLAFVFVVYLGWKV